MCDSSGMSTVPGTAPTSASRAIRPSVRLATRHDLPAVEIHMRRLLADELGGYDPALHADVDDLAGSYLASDTRALFVCTREVPGVGDVVAGTAIVRPGGPSAQYVPRWLWQRYADSPTGQLGRVWVDRHHRRHGVGRALALAGAVWALDRGFSPVCLHTNAAVPGALPFWRAFPGAVEVFDARPDDPWSSVHFEVDPGAVREALSAGHVLPTAHDDESDAPQCVQVGEGVGVEHHQVRAVPGLEATEVVGLAERGGGTGGGHRQHLRS
jgi:GNAT superfamily N-acetyltransferase